MAIQGSVCPLGVRGECQLQDGLLICVGDWLKDASSGDTLTGDLTWMKWLKGSLAAGHSTVLLIKACASRCEIGVKPLELRQEFFSIPERSNLPLCCTVQRSHHI